MTKLYIANCSNQIQQIRYRLPEVANRVIHFDLRPGEQKAAAGGINGELDQFQIDAIIEQLSVYGFYRADDITNTLIKTDLVYSLNSPISWIRQDAIRTRNTKFLNYLGKQLREQAAVAANAAMSVDGESGPNALELSITEEPSDGFFGSDHSPVAEGVVVSNNMEEAEARANGKPVRGRPHK